MKLVLLPEAKTDVKETYRYIARENSEAAKRTVARIKQKLQILIEFPNLGRPGLLPNTREYILPGMPYLIPYRISGREIQILRVYHSSRYPLHLPESH